VQRTWKTLVQRRAQERDQVRRRVGVLHGDRGHRRRPARDGATDGRIVRDRGVQRAPRLSARVPRPGIPVDGAHVPASGSQRVFGLSAVRARERLPVGNAHGEQGGDRRTHKLLEVRVRKRVSQPAERGGGQRRRGVRPVLVRIRVQYEREDVRERRLVRPSGDAEISARGRVPLGHIHVPGGRVWRTHRLSQVRVRERMSV